tara:strand:+ start:145 stop:1284 length:1140 start_codon:yes stop_codon:yes gene_type:complete
MAKPKYTSVVTPQYKIATKNTRVRYTIAENVEHHPDFASEVEEWIAETGATVPSFDGVFHPNHQPVLFDVRKLEIREDWGQRNALDEKRQAKVMGIIKKYDVYQIQPIDIYYIQEENIFLAGDGGGRATASYLRGVYEIPAVIRIVRTASQCRKLFVAQDKFNASLSNYEKWVQWLLDPSHNLHKTACDILNIASSSGFSLHIKDQTPDKPLVDGIGVLRRIIKKVGGDASTVKNGSKTAPNIVVAMDAIKKAFPKATEIPVNVLEAVTAYVHIARHRMPTGQAGAERLAYFLSEVRNSNIALSDLSNWSTVLHFDSSNKYAEYGAAALMREWNNVFKGKRTKKKEYKYVKWSDSNIERIKNSVEEPFCHDPTLFPQGV